jgi:hypothetical protein
MHLVYTTHAKDRITLRKIREEWIEKAIAEPDKLIDAHDGRMQAIKKVNRDKISVIYKEEEGVTVVITVYWGE